MSEIIPLNEYYLNFKEDYNLDIGYYLKRKAKDRIANTTYGRRYRYKRGYYTASLPGHPPNVKSGRLHKSIIAVPKKRTLYIGQGISGDSYAKYLERGTSKMAPRPNLYNIIDNNWEYIDNSVLRHIDKIFKLEGE